MRERELKLALQRRVEVAAEANTSGQKYSKAKQRERAADAIKPRKPVKVADNSHPKPQKYSGR